jgi:putative tricarboxylic transport membrane protein
VDAFTNLLMGFQIALSPYNLLIATLGIILGTIIGVLPGLGGANGVAILLPVTFVMPPTSAIILLSCIYWGALFGGAITSILFNIPGEPWSVATTFDGHPMAKQGLGGQALTAAFTSSFIGAAFAIILVTFFAPIIAEFSLKFGPPEFLGIQILTFSAFVGLGGSSPVKTIAATLLGFILATVGMDIVSGQLRLTFGTVELMRGFNFVVAVIGLFGIGEILLTVEEGLEFRGAKPQVRWRLIVETLRELPQYWRTFVRSALIGSWMGIKPGGATPASFMSYGIAKKFSKTPEKFGTGSPGRRPGARDRRPCRWGVGAVADDHPGHSGLANGGRDAGRPAHLGSAAGTDAVSGAARVCLGLDRQHVYRQRHRGAHRPAVRSRLCRDLAPAICHLDSTHHLCLRHRGLCRE